MSSITNQTTVDPIHAKAKADGSAVSKVKGIISVTLALLGLVVAVTGLGLFIAPHGPSAAKGWTFLGMTVSTMRGRLENKQIPSQPLQKHDFLIQTAKNQSLFIGLSSPF
ncbi:hypothetical protein HM1_0014 [Heliomicrobium modesticaldum Ice1]|uniref:Uncharacterized protein n=1 Tax=Heliobacterium modesticaldum (strain ATCC 51547 / Ice1) TaxID=498761 RepID=B0THW6_HELMI|nr:DUF4405 domain-containing protein [Heliomicrobium modesticaldum]ABZ82639.1 hypothetical protein HM1_0014 [Heliomicrobium modesticaldum Ice1]